MKFLFISFYILIVGKIVQCAQDESKADKLLSQMTLSEKLAMMHGKIGTYVGNIADNDRLGIPALKMQDGPQGFRTTGKTGGPGTSTAWPSALTIASSWDENLLYRWAVGMGEEFKQKGANVALGPGIGIARVPQAGRNFEYVCGEDPVLGAVLAPHVVRGLQENGLIANAKHFINNEIETDRKKVSADVSERVRFELYYPPFKAAIDAGVLSVMCSYNRVNGVHACQNNDTLSHLKQDMQFSGWVMTDWFAEPSTVTSMNAGLDQEMPEGVHYSEVAMEEALVKGQIDEQQIDDSVRRILTAMEKTGLLDQTEDTGNPQANVTSNAHNSLAREIAAKSTVLIKNSKALLPLTAKSLGSVTQDIEGTGESGGCIAVVGDETTVAGGGSGKVVPPYIITPAAGVATALEALHLDELMQVLYSSGEVLAEAVELAEKCALAVVVVATSSEEGSDRVTLSLGEDQDALVSSIAAVNQRTIVAVTNPGAVLMPWSNDVNVSAILLRGMPGQENGNALADVLFGKINPSARLPVTIPHKDNEVGFTDQQYPGVGNPPEASYLEGLLIGYRWYDANNVSPLYAFGHGLSYTSFVYSDISISPTPRTNGDSSGEVAAITTTILNSGTTYAGDETVQLYLSFPSSEQQEPPKQLKRFAKVALEVGQQKQVTFALKYRDVSVWSEETHSWQVVRGQFTVLVGASSRDIRQKATFTV